MRIGGKVAIVTGGCNGIGKGIVYALLRKAAKVAILDIDDISGKALQAKIENEFGQGQAVYKHCDVTQKKHLEDVFSNVKKTFGGLHIVVNNAGIASNEIWEKEIDIDLISAVRGTKLGIDLMDKNSGNDGGVVINMASMAGILPVFWASTYSAAKAGVIAFTRALRLAAKINGVRVNSICPAFVETKMVYQASQASAEFKRIVEETGILSVDQVADAVIKTIENDELAGRTITVTKNHGMCEHEFSNAKL